MSVCGVIAAAAAYYTIPGDGIIGSLPLLAICGAVSAFLPTELWIKLAMLPIMTFAFSTVKTGNTLHAAYMAALCLIINGLCVAAKYMTANLKKAAKLFTIVPIVISFLLNTAYCGFFADAVKCDGMLQEYFSQHYTDTVTATAAYYDHTSRSYKMELVSSAAPTEPRSLYIMGGRVYDSYKQRVQNILTVPAALLITSTIRDAFTNDSISLIDAKIIGYSPDKYDPTEQNVHSELMQFTVRLGGSMTKEEFLQRVTDYTRLLNFANVGFYRIEFIGGMGIYDVYSLTVKSGLIYSYGIDDIKPYGNTPYMFE